MLDIVFAGVLFVILVSISGQRVTGGSACSLRAQSTQQHNGAGQVTNHNRPWNMQRNHIAIMESHCQQYAARYVLTIIEELVVYTEVQVSHEVARFAALNTVCWRAGRTTTDFLFVFVVFVLLSHLLLFYLML